jgi:glycosyltransferase involved in cell wall biosynthesis
MIQKKVTTIIPTTGSDTLKQCIESVLDQTYPTQAYIVVDGFNYKEKVGDVLYNINTENKRVVVLNIPENVGANGFYGHRVYASIPHLVNAEYILFLDQDCWYRSDHVENMVKTIEQNNYDWCYSLRNITDKEGNFLCRDDCESLGKWNPVMQYNHVDTNCYCIKTNILTRICQVWHGGWGTDRVFYSALSQHFPEFGCSGKYTVNYRTGGNEGSVRGDFFKQWNNVVLDQFNKELPWSKE